MYKTYWGEILKRHKFEIENVGRTMLTCHHMKKKMFSNLEAICFLYFYFVFLHLFYTMF